MDEKRGRQKFHKNIGLSVLPPLQQMPLSMQTESASLAEAQRTIEVGMAWLSIQGALKFVASHNIRQMILILI